jgi:hypothetical protein
MGWEEGGEKSFGIGIGERRVDSRRSVASSYEADSHVDQKDDRFGFVHILSIVITEPSQDSNRIAAHNDEGTRHDGRQRIITNKSKCELVCSF